MYLDVYLNKLIKHMKKENIFDDTLLFVTADHGSYYAESPRKKILLKESALTMSI